MKITVFIWFLQTIMNLSLILLNDPHDFLVFFSSILFEKNSSEIELPTWVIENKIYALTFRNEPGFL